jgi:hypothetical protein
MTCTWERGTLCQLSLGDDNVILHVPERRILDHLCLRDESLRLPVPERREN